jgi:hypothetical protein
MKQKKNFLVYDILLLALTRRGQAFANCKQQWSVLLFEQWSTFRIPEMTSLKLLALV